MTQASVLGDWPTGMQWRSRGQLDFLDTDATTRLLTLTDLLAMQLVLIAQE